jgi:hypothetical protein
MFDYLADVIYAKERASYELADRRRICADLIAERQRAQAKPIRWALNTIYPSYVAIVTSGAFLAVLIAVVWLQFRA